MARIAPGIESRLRIEEISGVSVGREMLIIGRKNETTTLDGVAVGERYRIGQVTSVSNAVAVMKARGFTVKFSSQTQLDLTETDEVAAMVIMVALQYENYQPSAPSYSLEPVNVSFVTLEDTATDMSDMDFESFEGQIIDTVVSPFPYETGDIDDETSWVSLLKDQMDARRNKYGLSRGLGWTFMANTSVNARTDLASLDQIDWEYATALNYKFETTGYEPSLGQINTAHALHFLANPIPFNGRSGEVIPLIPSPDQDSMAYDDEVIANLLNKGWSTLKADTSNNEVASVRAISTQVNDPVTELPRQFFYDFNDYRVAQVGQELVLARVKERNLINQSFTVRADGSSDILEKVVDIMKAVDLDLADRGLVSQDSASLGQFYKAEFDPDTSGKVNVEKPLFAREILFNLDITTVVRNMRTVQSTLAA